VSEIEKAYSSSPNTVKLRLHLKIKTQVVISILLPQKYVHPATILVNASISQDCASKPNVYLAHHYTLDLNSLNDQVHLYKAEIPTFARTLKDLIRSPSTSHWSKTPHPDLRHPPEELAPSEPTCPAGLFFSLINPTIKTGFSKCLLIYSLFTAWHTCIWGVSPILLCRSSQALSGWMGSIAAQLFSGLSQDVRSG
jgi:hypothetical protein